jgi:hypothetical protein
MEYCGKTNTCLSIIANVVKMCEGPHKTTPPSDKLKGEDICAISIRIIIAYL